MGFYNYYRLLKEIRFLLRNKKIKKILTIIIIFIIVISILHTKGYCASYTTLTWVPKSFYFSESSLRVFSILPPQSNINNYPWTSFAVYSLKSGSSYRFTSKTNTSTTCYSLFVMPEEFDYSNSTTFDSARMEGGYCSVFTIPSSAYQYYDYNCGADVYILIPLYNYTSGTTINAYDKITVSLIDKEASATDITNQTNTITGSIADSTDDINNTITDSTDAINDTLTDNNVTVNSNQLVTDNTNDITQDGFTNIFTTIQTAFTGNPSAIVLPLGFLGNGQQLTLQPDFLSSAMRTGGLGVLVNVVNAFWYFVVCRYIVKQISKIIENLKEGNLEETSGNIHTEVF